MTKKNDVVLIFQIGSLGDTVISMPCYREIARRHPNATRYLLTNFPVGSKMVAAESILSGTGLIAGSIDYPMPLRGTQAIKALYRKLATLNATALYYLTPETKWNRLVRHYTFFRLCGISKIHGVPWSHDLRYPRKLKSEEIWESEASRLLRCIGGRDEPGPPPVSDRSLQLSESESRAPLSALEKSFGTAPFLAVSVGGKVPVNNWGDDKWSELLAALTREYPALGLLLVGSADERNRNESLSHSWKGPCFNSCGKFSPRETAVLLDRASLFIGHDTGTLHLAAATDTRIIGIYSARNVPGKWFSDRPEDTFLYNRVKCFGCECVQVVECPNDRLCITSIQPNQVLAAAKLRLAELNIQSDAGPIAGLTTIEQR